MKSARRTRLACCLALLGSFTVHARDLAAWRAGDTADEDITMTVALDVIDADATVARKAEVALKTPAIYCVHSSVSNTMVLKVVAVFAETHSNFLAGIQGKYQQTSLNETTIQSPDFGYFLTAFNVTNKKFPITTELARQWAHGGTGLAMQTNLIELLLQTMSRPVRPDDDPDGFALGDTVRLIPVHSSRDALTLAQVEQNGTLVSLTNVTTVTRLRGLFRRDFLPEDQLVARTLANYLHPNCVLDTNLTRQARARAVSQIVVAYHYDAGQVIVRRGQVIDAKIQAALTRLNETMPPGQFSQQSPSQPTGKTGEHGFQQPSQSSNSPAHNLWLVAVLAAVSAVVLLVFWRLLALRRRTATGPARLVDPPAQNNPALLAELAPQLALALKSAVAQELAAQRWELLQTQQTAAAEVLRLMHRLNDLHAPLQERLGAYESRIQELEKELAARTEENRELLKLKIDLLRQQLKAERAPQRVNFN